MVAERPTEILKNFLERESHKGEPIKEKTMEAIHNKYKSLEITSV